MLVEIRTVQDYNLYVNLTNVATVRVVPVNNRKFAIAMDILPGKTILVKVLGENYYDTREEADGIAAEFVEVFNEVSTKGQANVDDSLCWFGVCDGFDSGSEEPDCEPEEGEDDDEAELAESFEVSDEFTGYYTGEGTPTFGDLQGEDFGITSIEETSPGVYTIVLSGTVKVFDDNPRRFGHGGIVALLGLKYNLPPAYANAEGLTETGVVWTTPIQSQEAFNEGYKWRGSVNTGHYDSLILTSNVYSLIDEDFLKFAVNWGGTKDEETGYVEYILDIRNVVFEEVSVTGVAVNEEALTLMALEEAQLDDEEPEEDEDEEEVEIEEGED